MSNSLPARLKNLTFDGNDIQKSDISMHFDIEQGLNDGLEVRGEDSVVPGAAGRVFRNRERDVRHLVLRGILQGTGATETVRQGSYQNLCDQVESYFPLDDDPATLVGEARDGTWRAIDARATTIIWDPEPVFGVGWVVVNLDSVEPDWQVTGGGS